MEEQINKLKLEYQTTNPPAGLASDGLDDLWLRVDSKPVHNFRFLYSFAVILIAFIILGGSVIVISAKSKPGEKLYPIKTLTNHVTNTVDKTPVGQFYDSEIEQKKIIKRKPTPTPTASPTPSIAPWGKLENKNSKKFDWKSNDSENKTSNQPNNTQNSNERVKGTWTHRYQAKPTSFSENSQWRNRNHSGNRSRSNFNR